MYNIILSHEIVLAELKKQKRRIEEYSKINYFVYSEWNMWSTEWDFKNKIGQSVKATTLSYRIW